MAKQTSFTHQKSVLAQFLSLLKGFKNSFKLLIRKFNECVFTLYEEQGLCFVGHSGANRGRRHPFIEKECNFISSH